MFFVILAVKIIANTAYMNTKKLQEEKEKFEALFQHASMGILVANASAEIVLANDFLQITQPPFFFVVGFVSVVPSA